MFNVSVSYYPSKWHRKCYFLNPEIFKGFKAISYERTLPQKWDEFTARDLKAIARANFLMEDKAVKQIYLAHHFLRLPIWVFHHLGITDAMHVYNHISAMLDENTLARTIIKSLDVSFRKRLIGPADYASNLTFLEWIKVDLFYSKFMQTKDETFLNKLIAVLYREKRDDVDEFDLEYRGDMRIPFNEYQVQERAVLIAKLEKATKYSILLQYSGLRKWIQSKYQETFKEKKSGQFGWAGLIISLAGDKFGKDDEVAGTLLHAILIHLEMTEVQAQKQ